MPRNGSGTFSITNSFSSGTTIESSAMNANFSDIGTEITGSLPRDGQAGMTGQLKAASGTAAAPGMTFGSDLDTGFYRSGSNEIGVAVGGVNVATFDSGGVSYFPAGTVMLFAQTAAPTGWTKSTSHNDKALRVVSGTASSGGSTAFTSVFSARTIAEANLPSHTHTGTTASDGAHTHGMSDGTVFNNTPSTTAFSYDTTAANTLYVDNNRVTDSGGAHTHTFTTAATGSGTAMDFAVQYVDVILATKD